MSEAAAGWLRGVARGEEEALMALYQQYGSLVYSMALRVVNDRQSAEEVTQDVFLALWRNAGQYDQARGAFSTWLLTITRYRAIDALRRNAGQPPATLLEETFPAATQDLLPAITVQRALAELPPDQQTCIDLLYFKGYTQQEVADELQIPVGTVKGRVRLAMEKLRRLLGV